MCSCMLSICCFMYVPNYMFFFVYDYVSSWYIYFWEWPHQFNASVLFWPNEFCFGQVIVWHLGANAVFNSRVETQIRFRFKTDQNPHCTHMPKSICNMEAQIFQNYLNFFIQSFFFNLHHKKIKLCLPFLILELFPIFIFPVMLSK